MVVEACVSWNPLPDAANEYWDVDVMFFQESPRSNEFEGLSLIVASQWQIPGDNNDAAWVRKAWRLRFPWCRAYRKRTVDYPGNPPLTRPDQRKATWEIFPSDFLVEEGIPSGLVSEVVDNAMRYHHFVILTGGNTVYEVISTGWIGEPAGDEWAHPFAKSP